MTAFLRMSFFIALALTIAGCTGSMVLLSQADGIRLIDDSFTKDQIKEAIMEGAGSAGWNAKDLGNGNVSATYQIRAHTVVVRISYTDSSYIIRYKSSNGMKMFCSERDRAKTRDLRVSGQDSCPGDRNPVYIHGNYKKWVDSLNEGIQTALALQ